MSTKVYPVGDALYTEKFSAFTNSTETISGKTYQELILEKLNTNLSSWKTNIYQVLLSKWYNYEITGSSEDEEFSFISTIIDMYSDYYKQRLAAYLKEFDFESGIITTSGKTYTTHDAGTSGIDATGEAHNTADITGHSASATTGTNSETETPNLIHSNIDLPNKVTSKEYVSSRTNDTGTDVTATTASGTGSEDTTGHNASVATSTNSTDITDSRDKTGNDTETITDKSKYLEQKKKYLELLENIYLEFADKFSDCFIHIFN